ncbi:MAG: hypothetical protein HKO68_05355 [Desulfobacterales bacterium]|nr:hypothetical protein [Deltaproteobacteria bacterium]NNL75747.1 hypothetical protein [Desulfobacterales bacterium]
MDRPTIMVIGIGDLGGHVLELLARSPGSRRIITADINEEWGYRKTNIVAFGAAQMGYYPDLRFEKIDLYNVEQTAELIAQFKPDIIYSAVSLQSWWVINTLPQEVFEELDIARFGPWLPMHLTLVHKLMRAVRQTGLDIKVINSAFPDAVGPVLDKVDMAPTIGIGNVANPVPAIRGSIAHRLQRPIKDVTVYFFAQHYVSHYLPRFGTAGGAPYYLKAVVDGDDVTSQLNMDEVFADIPKRFRRPGGRDGQILTASSAAAITLAMEGDTGDMMHAPSPSGYPGGYPVQVNKDGGRVILPKGLTMEEAVRINEEGQQFDGIDRIEDDGTVYYAEKSVSIMKEMVGYDCSVMKLDETEACSEEINKKFKEFAAKFGKP